MSKRARVKVKSGAGAVTRREAAAEFGRKKAKLKRKQSHRRILLVAGGLFAAYVAVGGWWLVHTGKLEKGVDTADARLWHWTASIGFHLDQVVLTGREHADLREVKAALAVTSGAPILALPLSEMKARLEKIPEVKTVTITRTLPNLLQVAITERKPAALWQTGGNLQLIDRDGVVLPHDTYHGKGAMLIVTGEDAPKHMPELVALLDTVPSLKPDVVAAIRVGGRRWNLQLAREMVVMLPEEEPAAAWQRFADLAASKRLFAKAIKSIDMRVEDRVFILPLEEKKSMITLTNARDT